MTHDIGSLRLGRGGSGMTLYLGSYSGLDLPWPEFRAEALDPGRSEDQADRLAMLRELLRVAPELGMDPGTDVERTVAHVGKSGRTVAVAIALDDGLTIVASKAVLSLLPGSSEWPEPWMKAVTEVTGIRSKRQDPRSRPTGNSGRPANVLTEHMRARLVPVSFLSRDRGWVPAMAVPGGGSTVPVCFSDLVGSRVYPTGPERVRFDGIP